MPLVLPPDDVSGAFEQPFSPADFCHVMFPPVPFPVPLPATIAGGSNWLSGLVFSDGYRSLSVAVQSTQAGALNIQLYMDIAGTIPRAAVNNTVLVANTLYIVDIPAAAATIAQAPFASFTLQITNTSGSTATLTNFQAILAAG